MQGGPDGKVKSRLIVDYSRRFGRRNTLNRCEQGSNFVALWIPYFNAELLSGNPFCSETPTNCWLWLFQYFMEVLSYYVGRYISRLIYIRFISNQSIQSQVGQMNRFNQKSSECYPFHSVQSQVGQINRFNQKSSGKLSIPFNSITTSGQMNQFNKKSSGDSSKLA